MTDVKMPGDMSGLDLAHAVRNAFPSIPVVVISGYPSPETDKHSLQDFESIPKPFKPDDLVGSVKRALGRAKKQSAYS